MSGEPLKQARFARGDVKMVQLYLALRPGERRGACECGDVAVFVDAVEKRFATGGGNRPKGDSNSRARRNANASADGENGIEDGANRVRERPAVHDRDRRPDSVAATEESRPVCLEFRCADSLAVNDRQMRGPDFWVAWRPLSPRRQDGADIGKIFRHHEQLREGGMRYVGVLGREDEFS